jgi:uncharacterized protein (TIGR02588 family)
MTPERNRAAAVAKRAEASTDEPHRPSGQETPLLEWIVGGLGAALVGGAIAFLVYHALARDQTPPDIRVQAERVLDLEHGYLVQFRAFNHGNSAAAEVGIEGELAGPDGDTEVSEVVLDYLPPHSDREGGLVFSRDPRAGQLSLRAKGHASP